MNYSSANFFVVISWTMASVPKVSGQNLHSSLIGSEEGICEKIIHSNFHVWLLLIASAMPCGHGFRARTFMRSCTERSVMSHRPAIGGQNLVVWTLLLLSGLFLHENMRDMKQKRVQKRREGYDYQILPSIWEREHLNSSTPHTMSKPKDCAVSHSCTV